VAVVGADLAAADVVVLALIGCGGGGGVFGLALGVGAVDDEAGAFVPDAEEVLAIVGEGVAFGGVVLGGGGADCGEAGAPGGGEGHDGAVIAIVGRWGGDGAFLPVKVVLDEAHQAFGVNGSSFDDVVQPGRHVKGGGTAALGRAGEAEEAPDSRHVVVGVAVA